MTNVKKNLTRLYIEASSEAKLLAPNMLCALSAVHNEGYKQTVKQENIADNHIHLQHWRSSHYTVTHVRNKYSNIQGWSPKLNVIKVIFHTIRNCS